MATVHGKLPQSLPDITSFYNLQELSKKGWVDLSVIIAREVVLAVVVTPSFHGFSPKSTI